ncbi:MAG: signal recognition particle-docking protein FtsY [Nanoarchaeota archaeon]
MFGFLKDKLKKTLSVFSKKVEQEIEKPAEPEKKREEKPAEKRVEKREERKEFPPETKKVEPKKEHREERKPEPWKEEQRKAEPKHAEKKAEPVVEDKRPEERRGFLGIFKRKPEEKKLEGKRPDEKKAEEEKKQEPAAEEKKPEEKKAVFARISDSFTTQKLSRDKFDDLFFDLEIMLMENNVAVEVIEKIKEDLQERLVDKPLRRGKLEETVEASLVQSLRSLFDVEQVDLIARIRKKRPFVICFVGVNGSGKTTTIAKLAHYLKGKGMSCVLAAGDTFRAASHEQLQIHADNLGVKLIKHDYGADPAAVAFDAIEHARAKDKDVVLIDTAGRQHSNQNLMDELRKVIRVAKPDLKIFVGDSLTGNDCIEQAREFNSAVGIDGIVLSKVDVDEKGGAAISISYVTRRPIMFIGTGQEYADLEPFESQKVLESLGL